MRNLVLVGVVLFTFFTACNDDNLPDINGMWQLKTIEEDNHPTQTIDTIFYSFQRQAIFEYTLLHEEENLPATYTAICGYIDFPNNDHLHIQMDKSVFINKVTGEKEYFQLDKLLWKEEETTYEINELNSKKLKLRQNGVDYNFIKY
jgi:hypothetical protein